MTDLFSVCVRFNGGNPRMFKVRYINVTVKGLKNQLDEINKELNPRDTRRVEYIWYERSTLDDERITFSRLELKNDNDVRSMFLIFWQRSMVPVIDMFVTLRRSTEDILNSLIPLEYRD
ncbi:40S ribosomal S10-like protein, putative [Medicago truncatula]|uniref:40S ribosomal S10-like protein, putative n=1 Tax=Medicago truncatula TaxID=3880 RepID=G7IN08_MEDTR|nr:40S ribosomal S10-like protein, putative [Medicago truncatula]